MLHRGLSDRAVVGCCCCCSELWLQESPRGLPPSPSPLSPSPLPPSPVPSRRAAGAPPAAPCPARHRGPATGTGGSGLQTGVPEGGGRHAAYPQPHRPRAQAPEGRACECCGGCTRGSLNGGVVATASHVVATASHVVAITSHVVAVPITAWLPRPCCYEWELCLRQWGG